MKKLRIVLLTLLLICISTPLWDIANYIQDNPSIAADVNEGSTAILTLTFKNELGVLTTPTTVEYRLDDISSGTMIRDWTAVSPTSSSLDVEITNLENAILKGTHTKEMRRVTVRWTYPTGKYGKDEYEYNVKNLAKIQ